LTKIICPRCGEEGYLTAATVKGKKYLYVLHKTDGKMVKHYIGPESGYTAVNKLYGFGISNLLDANLTYVLASILERILDDIKDEKDADRKAKKIAEVERILKANMKKIRSLKDKSGERGNAKDAKPLEASNVQNG
jgi:hypothetical protein